MKIYQIRLGTMDQQHAESEWQLRSYTRSAKKQRLAGDDEEEGGGRKGTGNLKRFGE